HRGQYQGRTHTRSCKNDVSDCREKINSLSAFSAFSAFDLLNIFFIV
ncbi:unnamed protein product, partial [Callosobruchus maculatus]